MEQAARMRGEELGGFIRRAALTLAQHVLQLSPAAMLAALDDGPTQGEPEKNRADSPEDEGAGSRTSQAQEEGQ